jgi:hypothetical protein
MNLDDEVDQVWSHEPAKFRLGIHQVNAGIGFLFHVKHVLHDFSLVLFFIQGIGSALGFLLQTFYADLDGKGIGSR